MLFNGNALTDIVTFGGNIWHLSKNSELKDSDLKYRYIKILGKATSKDLLQLETIFTYDRNRDSIFMIRKKTEDYGKLVKKKAERIEQTQTNGVK